MLSITWCKHSTGALDRGFSIVIKTGLIYKYFSKGVKSHLNSDPLSNTTLIARGYLHRNVLSNNWLTTEYYLSMYSSFIPVTSSRLNVGTSTILNQPIVESIFFMQARLKLLLMMAPHSCCFLMNIFMDLSYIQEPYPTVLVLQCYWVTDVHKEPLYFWTVGMSCTAYHIDLIAWQGLCISIPLGLFIKYTTIEVLYIEIVPI